MEERPRRRLSGRARALALDLRRVRRRRGRQRRLPRPGRGRREAVPRPPGHPGRDLHDAPRLDARAHDRRLHARARPLRLGADPGRAAGPRRPPLAAELRLRLVPAPPARLRVAARAPRRRPRRRRPLAPPRRARAARARRPGVHRRPHARPLPPHRRRLAALRTGGCGSRRSGSSWTRSASSRACRNVLLVQATASLATLVPRQPGGIGTEQAFLVYTLRGQARPLRRCSRSASA